MLTSLIKPPQSLSASRSRSRGRYYLQEVYLFKLANSDSDPNIVQIFNADRTVLYATVHTIPTERQEPTGDTVIALVEQGAGQPDALLKWFYTGRETGNEFLYPKQKEKELAQDKQQTMWPTTRRYQTLI